MCVCVCANHLELLEGMLNLLWKQRNYYEESTHHHQLCSVMNFMVFCRGKNVVNAETKKQILNL